MTMPPLHLTLATPDNLQRSGKLFRVLALVIRYLLHLHDVKIRLKEDIAFKISIEFLVV